MISKIFPLNYSEFLQTKISNSFEENLVFFGLPGLKYLESRDQKIRILNEILETYILKDIKSLIREENIRAFNTLLYLITENQGSIAVISNMAREAGLTSKSIMHYFYDNGIRNIILKDYSPSYERNDCGILLEAFVFNQLNMF